MQTDDSCRHLLAETWYHYKGKANQNRKVICTPSLLLCTFPPQLEQQATALGMVFRSNIEVALAELLHTAPVTRLVAVIQTGLAHSARRREIKYKSALELTVPGNQKQARLGYLGTLHA